LKGKDLSTKPSKRDNVSSTRWKLSARDSAKKTKPNASSMKDSKKKLVSSRRKKKSLREEKERDSSSEPRRWPLRGRTQILPIIEKNQIDIFGPSIE